MATSLTKTAPGVRQHFPMKYGYAARYMRDPLQFWMDARRQYGDVFRYQIGPVHFYLLSHPRDIRYVLEERTENYPRGVLFDIFRIGTGDGLISVEGEAWEWQRRVAEPAFAIERLQSLVPLIVKHTGDMLQRWQGYARNGQTVDIMAELMRLQLAIISRFAFDVDLSGADDPRRRDLDIIGDYMNWKINNIFSMPPWFPTRRNLRLRSTMGRFRKAVDEVVAGRRADARDHGDVLSVLMLARDGKTGRAMDDRLLRDNVITTLLTGHEPGAVVFAWTSYLLARNAAAADRLRAELKDVLAGRTPTQADLSRLPYLKRVIQEAIRIYPAIYQTVRDARAEDEIGGFRIPKKATVFLCPYVTHRHPDVWDDPEAFDPDRFLPERTATRPPYSYFPFMGGPHLCIAREMAMLQAQLIVAMIVQNFRLQPKPGHQVVAETGVTVRPRGGLPMTIHAL